MRALYTILFYLAIPFVVLRLICRSRKAPEYRFRIAERFGYYHKRYPQDVIWFHAVSVGEAEAVFPLVRRIQSQLPERQILITTTTPTGSARVRAVLGETVAHVYLPYDIPFAVGRFLRCFKPKLTVIVETEIWPNLFVACRESKIPLSIINARLSTRSAAGYQWIPGLILPALDCVALIAAQTEEDAERYLAIGAKASQVRVVGNIKYDIEITEEIRQQGTNLKASAFAGRFVWLAASTHPGEEALLVEVYRKLKLAMPDLLLVITPRHPERFAEVGALCQKSGLAYVARTSRQPCEVKTDVYLADTMGELKMLYYAADLAFVGGSLVPVGGHNILEAAAAGTPIVFGPYMANFKAIADKFLTNNAALQCQDQDELAQIVAQLYANKIQRSALAANSWSVIGSNRGVVEKLLALLLNPFQQP